MDRGEDKMKLFKFDYDGYGDYYMVMSESPETALQALKNHLKNITDLGLRLEQFEEWENATIDKLPNNYFLKTFDEDIVEDGEYC